MGNCEKLIDKVRNSPKNVSPKDFIGFLACYNYEPKKKRKKKYGIKVTFIRPGCLPIQGHWPHGKSGTQQVDVNFVKVAIATIDRQELRYEK